MNDNQRQIGLSGNPDAASWFVRLQRFPDDRDVRNAFEAWLDADPAHREKEREWLRGFISKAGSEPARLARALPRGGAVAAAEPALHVAAFR